MPAFGYLETEDILQVNDRTRIFAGKSFSPKGSNPIETVRIRANSDEPWITVSGTNIQPKDWFLDWQYATPGTKVVELEITLQGGSPELFSTQLTVLSVADDNLYSSDQDLMAKEGDILKWVKAGRNSFLNFHRKSQDMILDWLDEIRVWKADGSRLTKSDLKPKEDLRKLSTLWTLEMIFFDISNKVDDSFMAKSLDYRSQRIAAQNRGRIQADFNGDGTQEKNENQDMRSFRMVRR